MSIEIRALVVTPDPDMIALFSAELLKLGVFTEHVSNDSGTAQALSRSKYEAVVLDLDEGGFNLSSLIKNRSIEANMNMVVIAVATESLTRQNAFAQGVRFILQRPFIPMQIRRTIRAAYNLMLQNGRHTFRLNVELEVAVRNITGTSIQCKAFNLSRNGMAIAASRSFAIKEVLQITFLLANSALPISAQATVVWNDKHGKMGLRFECEKPEFANQLYGWLENQFTRQLRRAAVGA